MIKEINKIKLPSIEKFGNFFTVVFFILSIYFLYFENFLLFVIFSIICLFTAILRIFFTSILIYPNKAWMILGLLLNKIISPIVLSVIFYFILTPVGVFRKLIGADELRLKKISSSTYWKKRGGEMLEAESFKNQF